mmetsp:Transcript_5953/g.19432  ORF Transcript_5953/g.19432 Transcript_5953/m.19432 type:complete len:129 (+) Transcript_5953:330-716(+)
MCTRCSRPSPSPTLNQSARPLPCRVCDLVDSTLTYSVYSVLALLYHGEPPRCCILEQVSKCPRKSNVELSTAVRLLHYLVNKVTADCLSTIFLLLPRPHVLPRGGQLFQLAAVLSEQVSNRRPGREDK